MANIEYTPNLVLAKQPTGARDWGAVLNENFEKIDAKAGNIQGSYNVGDIFYSMRTEKEFNGAAVCDGEIYNISDFSGASTIGELLTAGRLPYVSMTEYTTSLTANGSVRCFGWDGGETFRVPTLNDVFIQAGQAATPAEFLAESLPQHTHTRGSMEIKGTLGASENKVAIGNAQNTNLGVSGVFTQSNRENWLGYNGGGGGYSQGCTVTFTASRNWTGSTSNASGSTYVSGAKVRPDSVRYRAFVQLASKVRDVSFQDYTDRLQDETDTRIGEIRAVSAESMSNISELTNQGYQSILGVSDALRLNQITNCFLKIAQDVKLDLAEGALTAKQDSKVWIPYGTTQVYQIGDTDESGNKVVDISWDGSKFFYAIKLGSDLSLTGSITDSNKRLVYYNKDNRLLSFTNHSSGTTVPASGTNQMLYNTSDNTIKRYSNGALVDEGWSLPLSIIAANGQDIAGNIDQVFNGFGKIGGTMYALPGIKGLISKGWNPDGTYRNIEFTVNKVTTITRTDTRTTTYITLDTEGVLGISAPLDTGTTYYDAQNNIFVRNNSTDLGGNSMAAGTFTCANGKITSFEPKLAFQAADYNDLTSLSVQTTKDLAALKTEILGGLDGYTHAYGISSSSNPWQAWHEVKDKNGNRVLLEQWFSARGSTPATWTFPKPYKTYVFSGIGVLMRGGQAYHRGISGLSLTAMNWLTGDGFYDSQGYVVGR